MKKFFIFIGTLILNFIAVHSQHVLWTHRTARPIEKAFTEISFLHPIRYGIRRDIEVSTQPMFLYMTPNITLKKAFSLGREKLSGVHSLRYPTPFLQWKQRNGELLMTEYGEIPKIVSMKNEIRWSKFFKYQNSLGSFTNILTLQTGFEFSMGKDQQLLPGADAPMFFLFQEISYYPFTINAGAHASGILTEYLNYSIFVESYYYGSGWNMGFLNENYIIWYKNRKFKRQRKLMIGAGFQWYYRVNPGKDHVKIFPSVDVVYRFGNPFNASQELFIEEMKYY